ncbi:MAG: aminopeptidase P family protein [Saprospiraceae bacterium]
MNLHFFNPEIYHTRRSGLALSIQDGMILLAANEEVGMNYRDNAYPFRQESSFLYYCGIERPGIFLLIDSHTGESILIGDDMTMMDIVWTGPALTLNALADKSGIDRVISLQEGYQLIGALISKKVPIHYLPVYRGDQSFVLGKILQQPPEQIAQNYSQRLALEVVKMREIKSPEEIIQLTEAIRTSGNMHKVMMTTAKAGMTEANIMAGIRAECLRNNVDLPYPIILTINGQTLHNHSYSNILKEGQLLLGDFAAESPMHYSGDITRTIPVSPTFSGLQSDIYSLVLAALKQSIASAKQGIQYIDIHLNAAKLITEGLISLGFLSGHPDDLVEQGVHAMFFPHGLGHPLGLDVHDMEAIGEEYTGYEGELKRSSQFGLKSLRLAKTLKTGMVLTVEPGIYFIPELIALWKSENKFKDFIQYDKIEKVLPFGGIRIEDNVLVQDDHVQVIGPPIPKEIIEIELLRSEAYQ